MLYEMPAGSICPICRIRVSDWQKAGGKTIEIDGDTYHKSCLVDYKLRTGEDYLPRKLP